MGTIDAKIFPGLVQFKIKPSTQEAETVDLCGFQASLFCRVSSRTARKRQNNNNKRLKHLG